jgi:trimeric autotransporter adhesin
MKTTFKNSVFLPGRKRVMKLALGFMLGFAPGLMMAQNSSYDANTIPISGGNANCAFGFQAFQSNMSGMNCTAMGFGAMQNNVNGFANTGIGETAMFNHDGNENTALGSDVMSQGTTGSYNTALGRQALIMNNGDHNTGTGWIAMDFNNSGNGNSAYGSISMLTNVSGSDNSSFGYLSDVQTNNLNNATALGAAALSLNSDEVVLGDAAVAAGDVWSYGTYNTYSDGRFKTHVSESDVKGLAFIKLLRPVVYNFEARQATEFTSKGMSQLAREKRLAKDFSKATAERQSGFIAQEVAAAAKQSGYNFNGVHLPTNENDMYGISYAQMVVPLVKGMQEQQAMIEELQKQLAEQKKISAELQSKVGATTGVDPLSINMTGFSMSQNEPNPFTHETLIRYVLPQQTGTAFMNVYDLSGKQVKTFSLTEKGAASIVMTSDKLAAGIYIYSIIADGKVMDSKRMIVADK